MVLVILASITTILLALHFSFSVLYHLPLKFSTISYSLFTYTHKLFFHHQVFTDSIRAIPRIFCFYHCSSCFSVSISSSFSSSFLFSFIHSILLSSQFHLFSLFSFLYLITHHSVKMVLDSIKRHISYAFKCDSIVEKLKEQTELLENKRVRLQQSVDEAERNGEHIYENVTNWLRSAQSEIQEAEQLIQSKEEKKKCYVGLCPNLKARYQLSMKAAKKAGAIEEPLKEKEFDLISFRPPPQDIVDPFVYRREALPSRVMMLIQVMDALKCPNLNMIGVYGMGGIGKTTLAKEVYRKAVEEMLFEYVVMVTVSQTPDLGRIQGEIADVVGLKFDVNEVSSVRASRLYERLERLEVLIILDDIWAKLNLRSVGIPIDFDFKNSKILLTSRRKDILCFEMGTQRDFSLEVLYEDEARSLFEMTMGDAKHPELRAIANKVVKRCGGLPLLVIIVATYLKNRESSAWRDTLKKLFDFGKEELHEKVHKVLKSIYESLPGNEVKSFFLLCALFGRSNIPVNHLLTYALGLGLFGNIIRWQDARERSFQMIEKLKTESLLRDGDMNGYVKMHDVVLDVARSIATKEQHAFCGIGGYGSREWPSRDCTRIAISHCDINELPQGLEYPNAELFSFFREDLYLGIPDLFFEGFRELKVLNLTGMHFMSLPTSLHFLTNLHSLHLDGCQLDDVATIGELKQLEFLSFAESHIVELPKEIEQLSQLKLLDLTNCTQLEVFPANVLSKLSLLEELYIGNSFVKWDVEGNISVMELQELRYLTTLEIQVIHAKKMPNRLFFRRLQRYRIFIGDGWAWNGNYEASKIVKLRPKTVIHIEDGLIELFRGTQVLYLDDVRGIKNLLYGIDGEGCRQLKHLHLRNENAIRDIIYSTTWASCHAFPLLETLSLENLRYLFSPQLESIFSKMVVFSNLTSLIVRKCWSLQYIFKSSAIKTLLQLKRLVIECCEFVEEIILTEERINKIVFANLDFLRLADLPNLKKFGNIYPIEFQLLKQMEIKKCCKLRNITSNILSRGDNCDIHSLFSDMVTFPNLQIMRVSDMENLEYIWHSELRTDSFCKLKSLRISCCWSLLAVFSSNVVRRFQRLEDLNIFHCPKVEEIYQLGELNSNEVAPFELRHLKIKFMASLKRIWSSEDGDELFSFQNLKSIEVHECEFMEYVFPVYIACNLLLLEKLDIWNCSRVEHIVGEGKSIESNDEALHNFNFPELTFLRLQSLSKLRNFYPKTFFFEWPKLKYLEVRGCHKAMTLDVKVSSDLEALMLDSKNSIEFSMECFSSLKVIELSHSKDGDNSFPFFFLRQLHSLEKLVLTFSFLECIESILFDHEITVGEEENVTKIVPLKYLEVEHCDRLKYIIPSSVSFQNLTTLHVAYCEKLEYLTIAAKDGDDIEHNEVIFNRLKPLEFQCFPALKYLAINFCARLKNIDASSLVSFKNLTTLHVAYCDKLENLATISTTKTMVHLMRLRIQCCEIMKEIVAKDGDNAEHEITFNQLRCLELIDLPTLYNFCSGNNVFHFPLLEEVIVEDCLRMKIFSGSILSTPKLRGVRHWKYKDDVKYWEGNLNATIASQSFRKKVLQNAYRWYVIENSSFSKAILANQLQFLDNLRYLYVRDCDSILVLFDLEDVSVERGHDGLLSKLVELQLTNLPKLGELWNKDHEGMFDFRNFWLPKIYFRNLRLLKVQNCSSLKYAFTKSMASFLINLQVIEIENCKMMEVIIKEEEGEETKSAKMRLASVQKISIKNCPSMKDFMSPVPSREQNPRLNEEGTREQIIGMQERHEIEMPKLQELIIDWDIFKHKLDGNNQSDFFTRLKVIKLVFPSSSFSTMEGLVMGGFLVEEIIMDGLDNHHQLLPGLREIILFGLPNLRCMVYDDDPPKVHIFQNLQVLQVWECSSLRTLVSSFVYFQNLTFLQVSKCDGLINLITASTAKSLVQLKTIYVGRCKMMQEIVNVESDGKEDEICFLQLEYLVLDDLPCLTSFCPRMSSFNFPCLEEVFIIKCSNMMMFAQVLNTPKLSQVQTGGKEYEWKWEGSLNNTIQTLSMERP